jgi:tRNA(Arg) A34 adenosine deaminase TadA
MSLLFPLRTPADAHEFDRRAMELALQEARAAGARGEVPVGAIVVREGRVLGRAGNAVEQQCDATAHAEMLALSQAFAAAGEKRLTGAELFVTLEPCIQCAGALLHARIARLIYGADDPKFGGVVSLARVLEISGLNHRVAVRSGVLAAESADLLQEFFRALRHDSGGLPASPPDG